MADGGLVSFTSSRVIDPFGSFVQPFGCWPWPRVLRFSAAPSLGGCAALCGSPPRAPPPQPPPASPPVPPQPLRQTRTWGGRAPPRKILSTKNRERCGREDVQSGITKRYLQTAVMLGMGAPKHGLWYKRRPLLDDTLDGSLHIQRSLLPLARLRLLDLVIFTKVDGNWCWVQGHEHNKQRK